MKKIVVTLIALFVLGMSASAAFACKPVTPTVHHDVEGCDDVGDCAPPPVVNPPARGNVPVEDYCVQTAQFGEFYLQAEKGSFAPGGDWYALWQTGATVNVNGVAVTLLLEDGKAGRQAGVGDGVILAAHVPTAGGGYLATCSQPYVSTDGVYLDPAYGLR